jgi:hypothetical protein
MEGKVRAIVMTLDGQKEVSGKLTTESSASSYGQPVFIDDDGQVWDNWQILEFKGVRE